MGLVVVHQDRMELQNHVHVLTLAHMVVLNKVDGVIQVITRVVDYLKNKMTNNQKAVH